MQPLLLPRAPRARHALATLFFASLASAAAARAQTPPAAPPAPTVAPPRSEVTGRRSVEHVTIDGTTTLTLRPSSDGFQEVTVGAPAARLFAVLPNAFGDVGLTLKEFDDRLQQVGTSSFRAQFKLGKQRLSKYVDCGPDPMGLPKADSYAVTMRVTTQIVPESAERATVRTLVQASGRPPATSGQTVHCPSTGALEQLLADAVAARLTQ